MLRLLAGLVATIVLAGPAPGRGDALAVAAASSLRAPLDDLVAAFRRQHAGTEVRVSYAGSGTLVAQITNGAPFDVFFSADERYPRALVEGRAAVGASLVAYAIGRLALWVPKGSPISADDGVGVLRDPRIRRIAIANPAHAPYGRAAEEALRASGVFGAVESRLVLGEDVAQAAQFAESGNVDAALLPLSVAREPRLVAAGRHRVVPAQLHEPLVHDAVVTVHGRDRPAATALLRFTTSAEGQAILARWGYELPRR